MVRQKNNAPPKRGKILTHHTNTTTLPDSIPMVEAADIKIPETIK